MITATDMRKIAEENKPCFFNMVVDTIEKAAARGQFQTSFPFDDIEWNVALDTKARLEENGFQVHVSAIDCRIEIGW